MRSSTRTYVLVMDLGIFKSMAMQWAGSFANIVDTLLRASEHGFAGACYRQGTEGTSPPLLVGWMYGAVRVQDTYQSQKRSKVSPELTGSTKAYSTTWARICHRCCDFKCHTLQSRLPLKRATYLRPSPLLLWLPSSTDLVSFHPDLYVKDLASNSKDLRMPCLPVPYIPRIPYYVPFPWSIADYVDSATPLSPDQVEFRCLYLRIVFSHWFLPPSHYIR